MGNTIDLKATLSELHQIIVKQDYGTSRILVMVLQAIAAKVVCVLCNKRIASKKTTAATVTERAWDAAEKFGVSLQKFMAMAVVATLLSMNLVDVAGDIEYVAGLALDSKSAERGVLIPRDVFCALPMFIVTEALVRVFQCTTQLFREMETMSDSQGGGSRDEESGIEYTASCEVAQVNTKKEGLVVEKQIESDDENEAAEAAEGGAQQSACSVGWHILQEVSSFAGLVIFMALCVPGCLLRNTSTVLVQTTSLCIKSDHLIHALLVRFGYKSCCCVTAIVGNSMRLTCSALACCCIMMYNVFIQAASFSYMFLMDDVFINLIASFLGRTVALPSYFTEKPHILSSVLVDYFSRAVPSSSPIMTNSVGPSMDNLAYSVISCRDTLEIISFVLTFSYSIMFPVLLWIFIFEFSFLRGSQR
ncbi:Piso0_001002 [Millerozyma farinosa CBS 7064]|uniref:Piso0_001002 protein n=1 Tax=Pichia sorbitophila (strain ATCC MYA-4447 / BCRC 22081 / CBS 7064 / NBRC 10061 / NRRL Y-12695) TaxID=559304 RepID=G8YQN1_PICSO|nr:Piso0_001002 [Millerozyma farinosa CBS 7064]CCE78966.1 Piso0_001002 [Millerozyma farinosa CBS 7064]